MQIAKAMNKYIGLPIILVMLTLNLSQFCAAQLPTWVWAQKSNSGLCYGLANDGSGNTLSAGYFYSDTLFVGATYLLNTNTFGGGGDIFLVKYDINGNVIWARGASGTADDFAYGVASDANGNSYVCGSFSSDTLTFGSYNVFNVSPGTRDVFLAKFDPNGVPLWAVSGGGSNQDEGYSVAVDSIGNCYLTGYFKSPTMALGTDVFNQSGVKDFFIAKYDSNGNYIWGKRGEGNDQDESRSVVVDRYGNAWVAGFFEGQDLTIDTSTITNAWWGYSDIFLFKFDPNGNVIRKKGFGTGNHEQAYSLAADPFGNIFMGGWYKSTTLSFGTTTFTNQGLSDWFLVKFDQNINTIWEKSSGGTQNDVINSISADANGGVYTTGSFRNTNVFATATLVSAGFQDVFVSKYDGMGVEQFAFGTGATQQDGGTVILADELDGCVVSGAFVDSISFPPQPNLNGYGYFLAKTGTLTGVPNPNSETSLVVYPNPNQGVFSIELAEAGYFVLTSVLGKEILRSRLAPGAHSFDIRDFASGIYFVRIEQEGSQRTFKIIKE